MTQISKAKTAVVREPVNFEGKGEIIIEPDVLIGPFTSILAESLVRIGEGTQIAPGVCITDADHELKVLRNIKLTGEVKPIGIGQFCWIGANAVILKGASLGDYCIVGAGAVVNRAFPERSVLVGNPARILYIRDED